MNDKRKLPVRIYFAHCIGISFSTEYDQINKYHQIENIHIAIVAYHIISRTTENSTNDPESRSLLYHF